MQGAELIGIFLLGGLVAPGVMMLMNRMLAPKRPTPTKLMPYECGVTPIGDARVRFPFRFYIFAIFFVVFEIEVLFLFPWAAVYQRVLLEPTMQWSAFWEVVLFVFILMIGWIYAFRRGLLRWE